MVKPATQAVPKADVKAILDNAEKVEAQKTAAEKEAEKLQAPKAADDGPSEETQEVLQRLKAAEANNEYLASVVSTVVKGKAPPKEKAHRPAGEYKLTSPYWDGRQRVPSGTKMTFAEGLAPQSARFLGE